MKKVGKFLCSMKCAVILLLLLAGACTAGSFIPQGETANYYMTSYSEQAAGAILLFGLNDIFHCWWFVGLTLFLCVNLLCCNVLRFPGLIRRMKEDPEKSLKAWDGTAVVRMKERPDHLFSRMGFRKLREQTDGQGRTYLYASRNRIGIWGAWLCHLGMLIVIAGFGLGQMLQTVYTVYGVPGQTKPMGDTGEYTMTIDSFEVRLREDATVEQYESTLTVTDTRTGETRSGKASVNAPLSVFGWKCYQNSTGWAATVEIQKDGVTEQEELLCAGEYTLVEGMDGLAVVLSAFYPDYYEDENGRPMTLTPALRDPGYLYTLYYHDQVLGMNVLTGDEKITVGDYTIFFRDPTQYTLIQVKRDPFTPLAAVGGLMVLCSLILAFYVRPEELWAVREEDGTWAVSGRSRKGGAMFLDEIKKRGEQENGK